KGALLRYEDRDDLVEHRRVRPCAKARAVVAIRVDRDFRYGPTSPLPCGVERADHPVAQLVHPFQQVEGSHARDAWTVRGVALVSLVNPTALFRDTSAASIPAPHRL